MSTPTAAPALSVVVPVHNEAGNAVPLFIEIRDVLTALGRPFEVLVVNDGSTDATLEELCAQAAQHPCLRILDLDGNFGEAAALCAGFHAARGALIITLDGDGQNEPHDIPRLLDTLEAGGYRVVTGWRQRRQEEFMPRVLPSQLANRMIAAVTRIPTHDNGCGLKVYRRDVVADAALPHGLHRFMPAIFGVTAREVAEVPVHDRRRQHGRSHYGLGRTLVVLRDVLALRLILGDRQRSEPVALGTGGIAAAGALSSFLRGHHGLGCVLGIVAALALTIRWNLRRVDRAQRHGVYRLRREIHHPHAGQTPRRQSA